MQRELRKRARVEAARTQKAEKTERDSKLTANASDGKCRTTIEKTTLERLHYHIQNFDNGSYTKYESARNCYTYIHILFPLRFHRFYLFCTIPIHNLTKYRQARTDGNLFARIFVNFGRDGS